METESTGGQPEEQKQEQQPSSPKKQGPAKSPLEEQLERAPYNIDLWNRWLNDVMRQEDILVLREAYERLLKQFPTSVHARTNNFDGVGASLGAVRRNGDFRAAVRPSPADFFALSDVRTERGLVESLFGIYPAH